METEAKQYAISVG